MKEIMDPIPSGGSPGNDGFSNRKLIRPTLPRVENHGNHNPAPALAAVQRERPERHDRMERGDSDRDHGGERGDRDRKPRAELAGSAAARKAVPLEQTNAENFYYQKQMQSRTPMVIVLRDGEEVHGIIEWYDRSCIKVTREGGRANLMIYKPAIKYMFKESEGR